MGRFYFVGWVTLGCLAAAGCASAGEPGDESRGGGTSLLPTAGAGSGIPVAGTAAGAGAPVAGASSQTPSGAAAGAGAEPGQPGTAGGDAPAQTPVDPVTGEPVADPNPGQVPPGDDPVAGAPAPPDLAGDDRPPCLNAASEGVIVGDSYINWSTHTLPADLVARSGQTWRLYAVGGASMASGGIATLIPDQFELAVAADPNIKMVLMDGGGNDVMIPAATWVGGAECKNRTDAPMLQVCKDIVDFALERAQQGMERMAEVGVEDVIYFFYPEVPEGTPLGGLAPNAMLTYGRPLAQALCDGAEQVTGGKLRCHFIDMVPVFAGHNPAWFYPTDIHPNAMGSAAMADAIWQYMEGACIGQTPDSGCCRP